MTAKELKEQALTEPLHLASYYRFNEERLKEFCQQLCKEQRLSDLETHKLWKNHTQSDMYMENSPLVSDNL